MKYLRLIVWTDQKGKEHRFKLIDKVSSKWKDIGFQIDLTTNTLDGIGTQNAHDPTECWTVVMGKWLAGQGAEDYPVTWKGLCDLLKDIEASLYATELMKAISGAGLS